MFVFKLRTLLHALHLLSSKSGLESRSNSDNSGALVDMVV